MSASSTKDYSDVETATSLGQSTQSLLPLKNKRSTSPSKRNNSSDSINNIVETRNGPASNNSMEMKAFVTNEVEKVQSKTYTDFGKVISACLMYSSCSVGMVLMNKSLASSYNHLIDGHLNILLVVFQAITAVICVEFSKKMKWVEYPAFNFRTALQWSPVNILFCLMLFTSMASLSTNNVPIVTVFKNVTNIFTTAGDIFFFNNPVDKLVLFAFLIMLGGAIAAAWYDLYISFWGLFWMIMNCLSTAGYVLCLKFATKTIKLSKFGMVFYNNILCSIFLLPFASGMGEVRIFLDSPSIHTLDYFLKNFLAGFIGVFLNYASLTCVSYTGPTTYAIVGSLNKIPITFLGWWLFHSEITHETWLFIIVSMLGGFLYSYAKFRQR